MTLTKRTPAFVSDDLTELPVDLPGRLFRGPLPFGPFDERKIVMRRLKEEDVRMVVPLIEVGEDVRRTGLDLASLYTEAGYTVLPSPIRDFETPEAGQLDPVIDRVAEELRRGRNVMVHCNAGYGRTGIFLGCFARRILGLSGQAAVDWVRASIPVALENERQVAFVLNYPNQPPPA